MTPNNPERNEPVPDTQFSSITIDGNRTITAQGPYEPGLTGDQWELLGEPIVIFLVIKNDATGNPSLVANGVGKWPVPPAGEAGGNWIGAIVSDVPGDMQADDPVRAVGAAIQVKNDRTNPKNPPVVELVTWCVPQVLRAG